MTTPCKKGSLVFSLLTHPVQLVVEPARVAHRLPRAIPPPQSGGGRVTIGTLRPLSPLGVLKAEKAERLSTAKGEIRIGSQSRARKGELAGRNYGRTENRVFISLSPLFTLMK